MRGFRMAGVHRSAWLPLQTGSCTTGYFLSNLERGRLARLNVMIRGEAVPVGLDEIAGPPCPTRHQREGKLVRKSSATAFAYRKSLFRGPYTIIMLSYNELC